MRTHRDAIDHPQPFSAPGGPAENTTMTFANFAATFRQATGNPNPFPYQERFADAAELLAPRRRRLGVPPDRISRGSRTPHFPTGAFDPDCERRSDQIHNDAIRRFARLQRKYGWWHLAWLENLLRCADAMASADPAEEEAS